MASEPSDGSLPVSRPGQLPVSDNALRVEVFDSEVQRFGHTQPAAVKETSDEVRRVAPHVTDGLHQGPGLG